MLDMYIENIVYFRYFRKYHDIFQPWEYTTLKVIFNSLNAVQFITLAHIR